MSYGNKNDIIDDGNVPALRRMLKSGGVSGTVVLYGDEDYLKIHYAALIKDGCVPPEARSFDYAEFVGAVDTDTLRDLSSALPMASPRRLILLRDLELSALKDTEVSSLSDTAASLPDECVLLFVFVAAKVDMTSAKAKSIFKNALCVRLDRADISQLSNWIVKLAADKGRRISLRTAETLAELCGRDMYTVKNETEKLAAQTSDEITKDMLSDDALRSPETDAFMFADAMATENYSEAVWRLHDMELRKVRAADIMGAVHTVFADMYRAALALSEGKRPAVLKDTYTYGGKDFRLGKALKRLKNRPLSYFREAALLCAETDRKIKASFSETAAICELIGALAALSQGGAS